MKTIYVVNEGWNENYFTTPLKASLYLKGMMDDAMKHRSEEKRIAKYQRMLNENLSGTISTSDGDYKAWIEDGLVMKFKSFVDDDVSEICKVTLNPKYKGEK